MSNKIPIIDVSAFVNNTENKTEVAEQINRACREVGFFYIIGHGIDVNLQLKLEEISKKFFELPLESKLKTKRDAQLIGYFNVGDHLTSGLPDIREGIWIGEELDPDDEIAKQKTPLHGPNSFPDDDLPEFRHIILEYMNCLVNLGHKLVECLALSLGLEGSYFYDRYTKKPFHQIGLSHYPPLKSNTEVKNWGFGEHTDYGLLTILKQDKTGGLQIKTQSNEWIDAPPIENSFICNIGDMMDRITGGIYKSTLHRVKVQLEKDRYSFPFFFEPNFFSKVKMIDGLNTTIEDKENRWDKVSVYDFDGTYGEYILNKVYAAVPEAQTSIQ
ncbi:unnamed protein product [Brachionus calyciflorus]|uniref:Fe2OG dioxygenase domain-containing protein n=1 Tax=Brachionus calyciflorus TaxID=104777 RepID=A0A813PEV3_9BILA|nr:unnamed protein product [Brachionus calyciflorus]